MEFFYLFQDYQRKAGDWFKEELNFLYPKSTILILILLREHYFKSGIGPLGKVDRIAGDGKVETF